MTYSITKKTLIPITFYIAKCSSFCQLWNLYYLIQATQISSFWKQFDFLAIYLIKQTTLFLFQNVKKQKLPSILCFFLFFEEGFVHFIDSPNQRSGSLKFIIGNLITNIPLFLIQMALLFYLPECQNMVTFLQNAAALLFFSIMMIDVGQVNNFSCDPYIFVQNFQLKKHSLKIFLQEWLNSMLYFYCLLQCLKLEYFIKIFLIVNFSISVFASMVYQRYIKNVLQYGSIDFPDILVITIPILFHAHLDLRILGEEYFRLKQCLPIQLLDTFIILQLLQKLIVFVPIFIMYSDSRNQFQFQNKNYVLLALILIDMYLQIQKIYRFIISKMIHGPEYIELKSLDETNNLLMNEHKHKNLKYIKTTKYENVNIQLMLFSFHNCSIYGLANVGDIRIQSQINPIQQIVFIQSIDMKELQEQISMNFINPMVDKIIFTSHQTIIYILNFAKFLLENDDYKIIGFYYIGIFEYQEFLKTQFKSYFLPIKITLTQKLVFNKQILPKLNINPNQIFYDLYD